MSQPKLLFVKIIAVMEIVAGIWGISVNIIMIIRNLQLPNIIFGTILLLVNLLLLSAGLWLWSNEDRGYRWSRLLQAVQIPQIATPLITYQFIAGLYSIIRFGRGVGFAFGFTHICQIGFLEAIPVAIGINVVPLLALWYLRERVPAYDHLFTQEEDR